jgi:adenosylcobyric acid synthase
MSSPSLAPVLMIQGASSNVGKSLLVTALCRWFAHRGLKVAPFKAQNMALNSSVTFSGAEIGCAQFFQAEAAKVRATADMNPILLKPEGERTSQVIVLGKSMGSQGFRDYHEHKPQLRKVIAASLQRLRETHDLVIIEGAGSPAEINLKAHDLVNMFVALEAKAPVLLVGDIDKGGVFAALVGTLELLDPPERELVVGFVINKFRGDPSLLKSGLDMLENRTGKKVFGLIPYLNQHGIADEDSLALDTRASRLRRSLDGIDIGIVRWPRMSNYDEFNALERETETSVAFITQARDLLDADLLILPGTKATLSDLAWCRQQGLDLVIQERIRLGKPTMAICGGYQMLGQTISDPEGFEAPGGAIVPGLALIPRITRFEAQKITRQVHLTWHQAPWGLSSEATLEGYEIHMGRVFSTQGEGEETPFELWPIGDSSERALSLRESEGYLSPDQSLLGTLVHGLFENQDFRLALLNSLRARKGLPLLETSRVPSRELAYDRVAEHVGVHCDMKSLLKLLQLEERISL